MKNNLPAVFIILLAVFAISLLISSTPGINLGAIFGQVYGCTWTCDSKGKNCHNVCNLYNPTSSATKTSSMIGNCCPACSNCVGSPLCSAPPPGGCGPPTRTTTTTIRSTNTGSNIGGSGTGGNIGTTTTTTTTTSSTTTTTQVALTFDAGIVSCTEIENNVFRCSVDYTNNLGADATVIFEYSDKNGNVVSAPEAIVSTGSGTASSQFHCSTYGSGTYTVSWIAYKGTEFSNSVDSSKSSEIATVTCS